MSMSTVRRRVVMVKVKKTHKPHVPLPRRSTSRELTGERAKPYVGFAAPAPRVAPPRTWWQKALMPAGIFFGALVCGGFAYAVINASTRPSYDRTARTAETAPASSPARVSSPRVWGAQASSDHGGRATSDYAAQRDRAAVSSDDSFRASAYARKKAYLPNAAGDCAVQGRGSRDVGECLRQQGAR